MQQPQAVKITQDLQEFLQTHTRTFLFSLRKDGSPTGHPMKPSYSEGALYFNTYRKAPKARNMFRDSRVCCLVATRHNDPNFRAVLFRGKAEHIDWQLLPRPSVGEGLGSQDRLRTGLRIIFKLTPEQVDFLEKVRGG